MENGIEIATTNTLRGVHQKTPLYVILFWLLSTMTLWGLAFYEPAPGEKWLDTLQEVCFGKNESGLPEVYGWTLLIIAPLSFLFAYAVSYIREINETFFGAGNRKNLYLLLALLIPAIIQGIWTGGEIKKRIKNAAIEINFNAEESLPDSYPRTDLPAADFSLINQYGEKMNLSELKNKNILLSYVFAHCKTMCPAIVKSLQKANAGLEESRTLLLFITLDPWRDTPGNLTNFSRQWKLKSNEYILSGEPEYVQGILNAYNIPSSRDMKTGDIAHPAIAHIIADGNKIAWTFNNPDSDWIISAVNKLK